MCLIAGRSSSLSGRSRIWSGWCMPRGCWTTVARLGMTPLDSDQGLRLFGAAVAAGPPVVAAAELDTQALRGHARGGMLPALLRGIVRVPQRRAQPRAEIAAMSQAELVE